MNAFSTCGRKIGNLQEGKPLINSDYAEMKQRNEKIP